MEEGEGGDKWGEIGEWGINRGDSKVKGSVVKTTTIIITTTSLIITTTTIILRKASDN